MFVSALFSFNFCLSCSYSKVGTIILKKVGTIGGTDQQVKSRIRQILSRISKDVDFSVAEVRVRGAEGSRPPIYEVRLEDPDSAVSLRKAYAQLKGKKIPPELKGVGVFNSITLATRVRLSILRVGFFLILLCFDLCCFTLVFNSIFVRIAVFVRIAYVCFSFFSRSRSGTSGPIRQVWSLFRDTIPGPASGSRPPALPSPSGALDSLMPSRSLTQPGPSDCSILISGYVFWFSFLFSVFLDPDF